VKRTDADLDRAIRDILGQYTVARHNTASSRASSAAGRVVSLYSVWFKGSGVPGTAKQLIEPTSHGEAQEARRGLIVADIIDLIRGAA
jgi:hypothetical protein